MTPILAKFRMNEAHAQIPAHPNSESILGCPEIVKNRVTWSRTPPSITGHAMSRDKNAKTANTGKIMEVFSILGEFKTAPMHKMTSIVRKIAARMNKTREVYKAGLYPYCDSVIGSVHSIKLSSKHTCHKLKIGALRPLGTLNQSFMLDKRVKVSERIAEVKPTIFIRKIWSIFVSFQLFISVINFLAASKVTWATKIRVEMLNYSKCCQTKCS